MRTFVILLILIIGGGFALYKFAYPKLFTPKTQEQSGGNQAREDNEKDGTDGKKSDVISQCEELTSKGKLKEAIAILTTEIRKHKEQKSEELCRLHSLLAECYLKNNQIEEAEKTIIKVNREYPSKTPLVTRTLDCAIKQRDREKRIMMLESLRGCKGVAQQAFAMAENQLEVDNKILAWEFFTVALQSEEIDKKKAKEIKEKCAKFASELLFSAVQNEVGETYIVKKGDSLHSIAKKYKTTVELLQKINGMGKSRNIQPGNKLKILTGKFKIEIDKSERSLTIYFDGKYVKEYLVGIGKPEDETPIIPQTRIRTKITNPVWTKTNPPLPNEDPENPLGSRWMGFEEPFSSYGIHGIKPHLENTVGKAESDGCIRLVNKDVEEIFDIVVSLEQAGGEYGTEVTVKE